ncbi:MAG TPA: gamma-glutamyl-gamma-aminobutyrate hydrolase family protein [Amycolatopsis sp.]|nr:gamma-glutamyl-gamma-aminobutyrate hydrolase family protein [Amycolatopsis sp.]
MTGRRSGGVLAAGRDARFTGVDFDSYFSDFARMIAAAGGVPVYVPFEAGPEDVVSGLDAVVLSGGQDVHPGQWGGGQYAEERYTGDPRAGFMNYDPERDAHETELVRCAVRSGTPVLAVCRGMQLLNVALGGTLIPDLPESEVSHYSSHAAPDDAATGHEVRFSTGSLAHAVFGSSLLTNSWHHQAVAEPGDGLVVTGKARDGVAEVIELPGSPVLGVQWHPEWRVSPDGAFTWLVRAAAGAPTEPKPERSTAGLTYAMSREEA